MGQFNVNLNAEGLNYTINNSWYSRIGSQSGFAPLEHISAIENATVRVMPIWWTIIVASGLSVGALFLFNRDYYGYYSRDGLFTAAIIFIIILIIAFVWREDRVSVYVDGEEFVHFVAPPNQSQAMVQEFKKQLAALRNPPS